MKCRLPCIFALAGVLVVASSGSVQGDDVYELNWSTTDGGGGTSEADGYRLRGAVGQPDVETLTADGFVLRGGFWTKARRDESIPAVSEWGLTVMGLLVLTAGAFALRRQPARA